MVEKKRTLNGSKVCVKYGCYSATEIVEGIYQGTQLMYSEDKIFIVVTMDDKTDRFIPVDNIIYIDVLEVKYSEKKDEVDYYHG